MKRFVVNVLDLIASAAFFLAVFVAPIVIGIAGAATGGALMGLIYGIAAFVGSLVVGSLVFGTLFLLLEMNQNLRALVELQSRGPTGTIVKA